MGLSRREGCHRHKEGRWTDSISGKDESPLTFGFENQGTRTLKIIRQGEKKVSPCPSRDSTTNRPDELQHRINSLKNARGIYRREIGLLISEHVLEGAGSLEDFSNNKRASKCHFPPVRSSLDTPQGYLWEPVQHKHSLPSFLTGFPPPTLFCRLGPSILGSYKSPLAEDWQRLCWYSVPCHHTLLQVQRSPSKAVCKQPCQGQAQLQNDSYPRKRER